MRSRSALSSLPYCCARLAQLGDIVTAQTRGLGFLGCIGCRVSDVRDLFHFRARRDQPAPLPRRGGVRACRGFMVEIPRRPTCLHARRICGHYHNVRADDDSVPRRLAVAVPFSPSPNPGAYGLF